MKIEKNRNERCFGPIGGITAICMSYAINQSICWAILHFLCGWIYVIYWLFGYTNFRDWILQWVN